MLESVFVFIFDKVLGGVIGALPIPIQLAIYGVLGALGIFVGRKFIFINICMRFFPNLFVTMMTDLGKSCNTFFEKKKAKGKYKNSWKIAEEKLSEAITSFNNEIKKGPDVI